jgi:hypothetical protein
LVAAAKGGDDAAARAAERAAGAAAERAAAAALVAAAAAGGGAAAALVAAAKGGDDAAARAAERAAGAAAAKGGADAAAMVAERYDVKAKKIVLKQIGAEFEACQYYEDAFKSYEDAFESYVGAAKLGSVKAIYNMIRLLVLRKCKNGIQAKVAIIIALYKPKPDKPKPEFARSSKNEGITKAIAALQKNNQDMEGKAVEGKAVDKILNHGAIMGHLGSYCETNDKPLDACHWYSKAARKGNIHALQAFIEMLDKRRATQPNREYATADIPRWINEVSNKWFGIDTGAGSCGFFGRSVGMRCAARVERLGTSADELQQNLSEPECATKLDELKQRYPEISSAAATLG